MQLLKLRFHKEACFLPVLCQTLQKPFGYFKCSAIFSNILAHQHKIGIFLHTLMQAFFDGVDEPEFMSKAVM